MTNSTVQSELSANLTLLDCVRVPRDPGEMAKCAGTDHMYALPITHPVEVRAVLPRLFPSRAVKNQRLYLLIEYFQRHF
jgi:hypothetical protein